MEITWKIAVGGVSAAMALGFGVGRWTNKPDVTTVVDTKTSVDKVEDKRTVIDNVDNKTKIVHKGPVKTVTRRVTTKPSGEVEEEETVIDEGAVKTDETGSSATKTVIDDKTKTVAKSETHTETRSASPRNWLIGSSVSYGLTDVLTQQWQKPAVEVHAGYRLFGGVFVGVGGGYDFSSKSTKAGLHLDVAF